MEKKRLMKNRIYIIFLILVIIIIIFPYILKIVNQINQTYAITKYSDEIKNMNDDDINKKKKKYEEYNKSLQNNETNIINIFKQGEMLGYINIKKINIHLPIYEGTEDKTLLKGISHLENTFLPTTKSSYNAVFVGHTGISIKKYFDDLNLLNVGDSFEIIILDEIFKYKVIDKIKVTPSQTEKLTSKKNKKQAFLVTCIPKYVNSHRLIIIGEEKK